MIRPQPVVSCFYTTVESLLNHDHSFGFLGLHGKRLAAGERYTVPGNLIDSLAALATGPQGNRRPFQALERSVTLDHIVVIATPAVHLRDPAEDQAKMLRLQNGVLGVVDPCWGAYSSAG